MVSPIADGIVPWPQEAARAYTAAGWWRGQALGTELSAAADARPEATAVVDGATRLSYASLAARADALATRLTDGLGLARGDRIVVQLPNCWQFVVLTLACLRAGIVPVMALPAHRRHELAYLCEHSEARALAIPGTLRGFDHQAHGGGTARRVGDAAHILVTGQETRAGHEDLTALCAEPGDPAAERARWDADPPDAAGVAVFLLSGGTTGLPKLITRTHDDYSYNARASARAVPPRPGHGLPGHLARIAQLPAGLPRHPRRPAERRARGHAASPEPQRVFSTVEQEGVTITAVVPAVAGRWLGSAEQHGAGPLESLRVLQVGGARLADELARQGAPGTGRDAAAGVRHGRRPAELHPAG